MRNVVVVGSQWGDEGKGKGLKTTKPGWQPTRRENLSSVMARC